jgi:hypothetical protein
MFIMLYYSEIGARLRRPTAGVSGGGADREPALPEFYTCAGDTENAPESPEFYTRAGSALVAFESRRPLHTFAAGSLAAAVI